MEVRLVVLFGLMIWGRASASGVPLEIKRTSVNGAVIAYVEAGQGEPIVFIHGELQDYRAWSKHLEFFASDHRVIAYSRRNHYPNAIANDGAADFATDIHAKDLAAFVSALDLKSVHLVAHSSGAHAALFFAAEFPDMVRTMSLNEPPAIGMLRSSPMGLAMYRELETKLGPARAAFRNGQLANGVQMYTDVVGGAGRYEGLSEIIQGAMLDNAPAHVAEALAQDSPALFSCELARKIKAPTLLVNGSKSLPMFKRINEELRACLANYELVEIAATHAGPTDNPRAFDKAVREFIQERGR
jgi:pimeloyl-ACP methyl ester carboxylesterase